MYVLPRGQGCFSKVFPLTRQNTRSLAILSWSHPALRDSQVSASKMTEIIEAAQVHSSGVRLTYLKPILRERVEAPESFVLARVPSPLPGARAKTKLEGDSTSYRVLVLRTV